MPTAQELSIDTDASAMDMAESMFGQGIEIQSASYTGADGASGVFSGGDSTASGITPSDSGVILSTGNAGDVTNSAGDVNTSSGTSTNHGLAGDSDLTGVSGQSTFDAAIFEAEFIPQGDTLTMQVTFSSEEYLEYVNSGFNDAVGVWVNGVQAELTVGDGDITINNINDESNANLYVDNAASDDTYNTEMDGFTVTLTLKAPVNAGEVNSIKIGIADGGDGAYDSNLMIAGDSVQTALIAMDDDITLYGSQETSIDLLANDSSSVPGQLTITAINGQPVSVGDSVTLSTGEVITLTETGMIMATADGDADTNTFSYEVTDAAGNTDVAFVNLTTVPCFVAGTLISTEFGDVPVEAISPGMKVQTKDHGMQEVLWAGSTGRIGLGEDAPIEVCAGTLQAQENILVSPNHRLLVGGKHAEMFFGATEVLVAAKHLIGWPGIFRAETQSCVRYVHIMFRKHEIVHASGCWSESFHPGQETMANNTAIGRDVGKVLGNLGLSGPEAYGPTARPVLRRFEAQLMAVPQPLGFEIRHRASV